MDAQDKKTDIKSLVLNIAFALAAGGIGALLGGKMNDFATINKPWFSPPAIVFPIAWTALYILMGISTYLVCENKTDKKFKKRACFIYLAQLLVNVLWTPLFFRFKLYLLSFFWILLLIILVGIMIIKFYKIKPLAGYLQIPYILWLIFASILNFSIYLLN